MASDRVIPKSHELDASSNGRGDLGVSVWLDGIYSDTFCAFSFGPRYNAVEKRKFS